jgi:hypothetical protein
MAGGKGAQGYVGDDDYEDYDYYDEEGEEDEYDEDEYDEDVEVIWCQRSPDPQGYPQAEPALDERARRRPRPIRDI